MIKKRRIFLLEKNQDLEQKSFLESAAAKKELNILGFPVFSVVLYFQNQLSANRKESLEECLDFLRGWLKGDGDKFKNCPHCGLPFHDKYDDRQQFCTMYSSEGKVWDFDAEEWHEIFDSGIVVVALPSTYHGGDHIKSYATYQMADGTDKIIKQKDLPTDFLGYIEAGIADGPFYDREVIWETEVQPIYQMCIKNHILVISLETALTLSEDQWELHALNGKERSD